MVEEKKKETEFEKEENKCCQDCCHEDKEKEKASKENQCCNEQEIVKKEKQEQQQEHEGQEIEIEEPEQESEPEEGKEKEEVDLEEQIKTLKEENESYFNQLARLKADFVNFRKRITKEKSSISLTVKIEFVEELLPIIDNFERALMTTKENSDFKKGIEMIYKQLIDTLEKQGVEPIPAEGEPFDPNVHEAMLQVEEEGYSSGIIIEEFQKGYRLDDKVIRPSMVKVAQ